MLTVDAHPTKDFFISMLVRDISIYDAILDLIDNSVDAARRHHKKDLSKAEIDVDFGANFFSIKDNCGGLSLHDAKNYAFCFGRKLTGKNKNPSSQERAIGQFGVGMKRAFFKIGDESIVHSHTKEDIFEVDVDVPAWRRKPENEDWTFPYSLLKESTLADKGTLITIKQLHPEVSALVENKSFQTDLINSIKSAHLKTLTDGITIRVNQVEVEPIEIEFLVGKDFSPAYYSLALSADFSVTITAGVGRRSRKEAGWYVFLDDRLVLAADQSNITGWGEESLDISSPRYHNQYSRFRGVAQLESKNSSELPWNTTKRGLNWTDSKYQACKGLMVSEMKSVLKFLNELDRELDQDDEPLRDLVTDLETAGQFVSFDKLDYSASFKYPKQKKQKNFVNLSCKVPIYQAEQLKSVTGRITWSDLATYCFDFTYARCVEKE
jgi:hypothetical protein